MKKLVLLCTLLLGTIAFPQEDRYPKFMAEQLNSMDTAKSVESLQTISNNFERVALAEKSKWQPYYYASLCNILSSMTDNENQRKDSYLDKAELQLSLADSLLVHNSEIYTLKGLLAQARMLVNPMQRYMKYSPEATRNFEQAKQLDTTNPRPYYLIGQSTLYTPEQFGGGKAKALPILLKAKALYDNFVPKSPLDPIWGKKQLDAVLEQIQGKANESVK
jgi:hypothetical protein